MTPAGCGTRGRGYTRLVRRLALLTALACATTAVSTASLASAAGRSQSVPSPPSQVRSWQADGLLGGPISTLAPVATAGDLLNLVTVPWHTPSLLSMPISRRMSVLYVTDDAAVRVLDSSDEMRALPWLFRQDPSNSGGRAALALGTSQRMNKVNGRALAAAPSTQAMADMLREGVDRQCITPAGVNTCAAHQVGVDELVPSYGQPTGSTRPNPTNPGVRLSAAMQTLAGEASPWGGTYASRIHFYIAPAISTSIGVGRGRFRTLGRDGKHHFKNYAYLMPALSYAGGTWLEMYHFDGRGAPLDAFTPVEWRDVPTAMATFMRARTPSLDPLQSLHFVMTEATTVGCRRAPSVPPTAITRMAASQIRAIGTPAPITVAVGRRSAMSCVWTRAQTGPVNRRVLANGPGAFRVSSAAADDYGRLFRQFFLVA